MRHSKLFVRRILRHIPPLFFAFIAVSVVTYAQTFTGPTTVAPSGNIALPINTGPTIQIKAGNISASAIGTNNGFTLPNSDTWGNAYWDVDTTTSLSTLGTEQFCLSSTCVTDLKGTGITAPVDIYLNGSSCNSGWCSPDAATMLAVCVHNGYSHVVSVIPGGSSSNLQATRVTCDN